MSDKIKLVLILVSLLNLGKMILFFIQLRKYQ
jgi:hypothetical protein